VFRGGDHPTIGVWKGREEVVYIGSGVQRKKPRKEERGKKQKGRGEFGQLRKLAQLMKKEAAKKGGGIKGVDSGGRK